jgi:hypothetical protein
MGKGLSLRMTNSLVVIKDAVDICVSTSNHRQPFKANVLKQRFDYQSNIRVKALYLACQNSRSPVSHAHSQMSE